MQPQLQPQRIVYNTELKDMLKQEIDTIERSIYQALSVNLMKIRAGLLEEGVQGIGRIGFDRLAECYMEYGILQDDTYTGYDLVSLALDLKPDIAVNDEITFRDTYAIGITDRKRFRALTAVERTVPIKKTKDYLERGRDVLRFVKEQKQV